ncbi:MAG: hypothetical protein KAG34_06480 [Cocleimonas sp.]|nr:hypothetical protein [Cocleimonas sp.]
MIVHLGNEWYIHEQGLCMLLTFLLGTGLSSLHQSCNLGGTVLPSFITLIILQLDTYPQAN